MSDEQAETWRVIEESGEGRIVEVRYFTDKSFPYWEAYCHSDRRGGMLSQNSARHAVLELAANHKWNAVEVLAPGEPTRAELVAEIAALRSGAIVTEGMRSRFDAAINEREARLAARGELCTCGSGAHPHPCARHPQQYDRHVAELDREIDADNHAAEVATAWADGARAMQKAAALVASREANAWATGQRPALGVAIDGLAAAEAITDRIKALPIPEATNTETK